MMREKTSERIHNIFVIAFPLIIQGLVFQLQSLTDKAFLGNLDTKYVSAVGAAQMPFNAVVSAFCGISTGLIIIISKLYGADEKDKMAAYAKSAAFYNGLIGMLLGLMWLVATKPILQFFQIDSTILPLCIRYVRVCAIYLFVAGMDCSMQALLQGIGKTRPIMYAGIMKVGLNVLLSWVLIFGHFGFPRLDVFGAAIGTLAANLFSFGFVAVYCLAIKRRELGLTILDRQWFRWEMYKRVFILGVPVGVEYLLWSASNLVLVRFINGFGYLDMAIYTLSFGFQCIVYVIFESTSKATLTLMGHRIGAGKREGAERFFYTSIWLNFGIVAVAALGFLIFPQQLLHIFSNDNKVITNGAIYLVMIGAIMFPQSMNVICGNAIRANDDTKWMLISQILGSILVVSISWILIEVAHMNMMAVYITLLLDEAIRGTINFVYYRKKYGTGKSLKVDSMLTS